MNDKDYARLKKAFQHFNVDDEPGHGDVVHGIIPSSVDPGEFRDTVGLFALKGLTDDFLEGAYQLIVDFDPNYPDVLLRRIPK